MTVTAVVGGGFIGPVHIEALRRLGTRVKGILELTPELGQKAAQTLGLEVAYGSYQELLADTEVQVIHITTPNKTHFEMSKAALLAGKHVICEKPLAMNARETTELVQVAKAHPNLIGAVNYNIRFYPMVLQARAIVQSGELGEVYTLRGAYLQDWLLYDTDWNWRLLADEGGELRAIGDIGTHWMDLLHFVTGLKVESLVADLNTFIKQRKKPRQAVATFKGKEQSGPSEYDLVSIPTEDMGNVLFHYQGGARGAMMVSQVNAGRKNRLSFEIAGSKSALAWDSERPNELWIGHRERANEHVLRDPSLLAEGARAYTNYPGGHNEGFPDTFKQLYRAIYNYLEAGDFSKPRPFPTFEEGHDEVVLCEAILQSHRERRWVNV
ncbi:MAG TPA: Gfo/Idh/MocA family oxidoreductase [Aggregatilineaceae bacterium]|nr:Gfo/Idh/MocA family oxidoreductase [Aggregatilineaceae bacterium]